GVSLALSSAAVGCFACGVDCCGGAACCESVRFCSGGDVSEGFCARAGTQAANVAANPTERNRSFRCEQAIKSSATESLTSSPVAQVRLLDLRLFCSMSRAPLWSQSTFI